MTNEQRCAERIEREVIWPIRDEVLSKLPKWITNKLFVPSRVKRFCEVIVDISREYVRATIFQTIKEIELKKFKNMIKSDKEREKLEDALIKKWVNALKGD